MFDNVWLVLPRTKDLVSPYDLYSTSKPIEAAQPFTVSMATVVVAEDLDGILRGKNDVLVLSKSSLGAQPFVERVHFYGEEIPKGRPIRHMFAPSVFVTDDYSGTDHLWLELNVVEVDTDTGERKAAVSAFQSLSAMAGAVFPAIVPYLFAASKAAGVVNKLISALEDDEHVIKIQFSLHPGDPRPGNPPFQAGTYVAFGRPQDPAKYKLQSNGLLTIGNKPASVSYAVFNVAPEKRVNPDFVLTQKVATLLTQMKGNPNTPKASIKFLNETLTGYSNFKKLGRYLDLKKKKNPTDKEKALMAEIAKIEGLKPFLPKA
ncbi:MAG: hypothetical protein ACE5I9_03420 [Candidatus Methylomirabilales bacterium]